jgi:hypothetical protein
MFRSCFAVFVAIDRYATICSMNPSLSRVPRDLLDRDPSAAMGLLADEIRALHRSMHPADMLLFEVADHVLAMGRHEVPALAMLFEDHDVDAPTSRTALERAVAYLATGRLQRT